jgi:hypothetical protein
LRLIHKRIIIVKGGIRFLKEPSPNTNTTQTNRTNQKMPAYPKPFPMAPTKALPLLGGKGMGGRRDFEKLKLERGDVESLPS